MSQSVFLAVMVAAFMHAAWNAMIKSHGDRFASITQLGIAQGLLGLALTPFFPLPTDAIWLWIAASAALHTGYKLFLVRAYQSGDLGQIYPLSRGAAPLITALAAYVALGETMSALTTAGVSVLCFGIAVMAAKGSVLNGTRADGVLAALDRRAVGFALTVSLFIASYTMVDGVGARKAASFATYIVWMFAFDGAAMAAVYALRRGRSGAPLILRAWRTGAAASVLSFSAYWLVIWAMTQAPIASVAALREVSILFALAISTFVLREQASLWRIGAAICIVAGVVVIRVG